MNGYSISRTYLSESKNVCYGVALGSDILVQDIFRNEKKAREFISLLNSNDISSAHFDDVFTDYFAL